MSSPSPKPKWSARMGSVMRRTSSVLTISRPSSISSERDTDTASLSGSTKGREASTLSPPPPPVVTTPSPIAESPLREAEATTQEPVGPSPLAQPITSSKAEPIASPEAVPPTVPPPVEETQSPTGYIPPPVIDSTAGNPGAFTDVTDELPQPDIVQDPYAVAPAEEIQNPTSNVVRDQVTAPVEHVEPADSDPIVTEALVEEPVSYFDGPITESVKDFEPADDEHSKTEFAEAVDENAKAILPEPHHGQQGQGEAAEYYRDANPTTVKAVHEDANVVQREEPEAHHRDDFIPVTTEPEETQHKSEPIAIPVPAAVPNYNMPSYPINLGSGQEVWGGEHDYDREGLHHSYEGGYASSVPIVSRSENVNGDEGSPGPSIRMPEADPFADPIAPRITVSRPELDMPQPEFAEERHQGHAERHRDIHGPVAMPLPSFYEVTASKPIHHASSASSLRNEDNANLIETDETLPLLSRPGTPNRHKPTSYLQASANPHSRNHVSVSPLAGSQSTTSNGHARSWHPHPGAHPRLHSLGWLEYHLPDGTVYYVHPTNRVTTEINLRSERLLSGVELFLADHGKDQSGSAMEGILANGGEIWLRDVGTAKRGMVLERWWVDHRLRTVVMGVDEHEYGRKGSGKGKGTKGGAVHFEEDQLDTEYRYWSFMEAHPAHNSLPAKAKVEAMDVLTWAWTERLLPSHSAVPAPFTQEECQELMTLIRSFGDDHHDDHGIQTRIVSRVLLRVAHWRQSYFRPNKHLPTNVGPNPSHLPIAPRRPFRRAFIDFIVSCLFLGIPYIFFERARFSSRIDEESGLRNATPTLIIGACTCLVAAVVLSASVTFLSLPGLEAFSRTTGMVAILLAAFSMAATVVAIFRYKADLERPMSHLGIEGMMVITRRTVILSLPLVLLVYAIIAFVTGIVLYSFRGVALSDPSVTKKSFEDYTRWGVVSVVGVLVGMVTTSVLLFRR